MRKKVVLVIEDEKLVATALMIRLRAGGYEAYHAVDGQSGLVEAAVRLPDVILLDIRMPDIDGYEVCRRLKSDPQLSGIPVIFVSANANESTKEKAYEVGGTEFISKPYEPKAMVGVIGLVIGGK